MKKSWMLEHEKRRHSLQCYAHGAHPAPAAPYGWAVRLILRPTVVLPSPSSRLGSQSSPVQTALCSVLCCAALCCVLPLPPFPPRLPTFSFSTSTSCWNNRRARRPSPSSIKTIRVPVRGHADDQVSWSRLIRHRRVRSSPRPVSSSQPPRPSPSPSPAFEIRSAPYPRQAL